MKLKIGERNIDLSITKVMGIIPLSVDEPCDIDEKVKIAEAMYAAGAEFVEIGFNGKGDSVSEQQQLEALIPVVSKISEKTRLVVACSTIYPEVMKSAVKAGAKMIISPDALRFDGAIETVAKLDVPVCLMFDENAVFDKEAGDPVSSVSEFLFERIDACLNGGLSRKKLLLDPFLGNHASARSQLKLLGRLDSLKSFGVPLTFALPRPLSSNETFLKDNKAICITLALFCAEKGTVQILRTENVSDIALALGTWQLSLVNAKPFRLSKAIIIRFRNLRDKLSERRKRHKE